MKKNKFKIGFLVSTISGFLLSSIYFGKVISETTADHTIHNYVPLKNAFNSGLFWFAFFLLTLFLYIRSIKQKDN